MKKYVYWDNSVPWKNFSERKPIFTCEAETAEQADQLFFANSGIDLTSPKVASKHVHIAMQVIKQPS